MNRNDFIKFNQTIGILSRRMRKTQQNLVNERNRSDFLAKMCVDLCDHMDENEIPLPPHILKTMNDFVMQASNRKKSVFDIILDLENSDDD
jgi:hypothetical protein